jgi:hypothetical protein
MLSLLILGIALIVVGGLVAHVGGPRIATTLDHPPPRPLENCPVRLM